MLLSWHSVQLNIAVGLEKVALFMRIYKSPACIRPFVILSSQVPVIVWSIVCLSACLSNCLIGRGLKINHFFRSSYQNIGRFSPVCKTEDTSSVCWLIIVNWRLLFSDSGICLRYWSSIPPFAIDYWFTPRQLSSLLPATGAYCSSLSWRCKWLRSSKQSIGLLDYPGCPI